jgi:hypothetical protein
MGKNARFFGVILLDEIQHHRPDVWLVNAHNAIFDSVVLAIALWPAHQ